MAKSKPNVRGFAERMEKQVAAWVERYVYPHVLELLDRAEDKTGYRLALRSYGDAVFSIECNDYEWFTRESVELTMPKDRQAMPRRSHDELLIEFPGLFAALQAVEDVVELLHFDVQSDYPIIMTGPLRKLKRGK